MEGSLPALFGLAAGLALSGVSERMLKAVFPTHSHVDFVSYLLVTPALLAIALLATYIPARRASRVEPMQALRYE